MGGSAPIPPPTSTLVSVEKEREQAIRRREEQADPVTRAWLKAKKAEPGPKESKDEDRLPVVLEPDKTLKPKREAAEKDAAEEKRKNPNLSADTIVRGSFLELD